MEKISFYDFTVIAAETDKTIDDVPAEEVFDISDFREFHVTLSNSSGEKLLSDIDMKNIIDFEEWKKLKFRNTI